MFDDRFGLTQAVLEIRKTMTRRFLTQNYEKVSCLNINYEDRWHGELDGETYELLPRFQVGETVAIAQSYESIHDEMMNGDFGDSIYDAFRNAMVADKPGWKNKMFVSSYLMPHHIRITDIKIERLQDISDEDCLKEGLKDYIIGFGFDGWLNKRDELKHSPYPRTVFAALIDKVSGKGTWERNPWVFAYSFERID